MKKSARNKIVRPAITSASRQFVAAAKANLPSGKSSGSAGNLRRSTDFKVKTGKASVYGVIGPRSDFVGTGVNLWGKPIVARPAFYAHLVNAGAVAHIMGIGRNRKVLWVHPGAPATGFLDRAFSTTAPAAMSTIERKLAEGLEKYA